MLDHGISTQWPPCMVFPQRSGYTVWRSSLNSLSVRVLYTFSRQVTGCTHPKSVDLCFVEHVAYKTEVEVVTHMLCYSPPPGNISFCES